MTEYVFTRDQIVKFWCGALQSGNYKQGYGTLYNQRTRKYCCLGVLCRILGLHRDRSTNEFLYDKTASDTILPKDLYSALGMTASGKYFGNSLTHVNDIGYNFEEIANIIENNKISIFKNDEIKLNVSEKISEKIKNC